MCLVPRADVEVLDTWHVDGMIATGSHDIVATALHVPERNMSLLVPPVVTAGENATYLMRLPVPPFLSLTAAIPALGAARRAVELYRAHIAERVRFGTTKAQSQSAAAQIRLATAIADVRAAETNAARGCAGHRTSRARRVALSAARSDRDAAHHRARRARLSAGRAAT